MDAEQPSQAAKKQLQVYKRKDGKTDWRLVVNGDIVATSGGQGYESPAQAHRMGIRVTSGHYHTDDIKVLSDDGKLMKPFVEHLAEDVAEDVAEVVIDGA